MKKLMLLVAMLISLVLVSCSDDGDGDNNEPKTCTPACDAWETCNTTTGTCELTAGKCETNANCTDAAKPNCNTTTHVCEAAAVTCTPACDSWETCNNGTCELAAGKCESNTDCTDGKVCNTTTHICETETVECTPACEAWETCTAGDCVLQAGKCGTNADCEATETCNTTTHVCENSNPGECTGLSIEANTMEAYYMEDYQVYSYYVTVSETTDVNFEFYDVTPVGEYSLISEGVNDNYSSCMQCVTAYDYNAAGDAIEKTFFQSQGTLVVSTGEPLETGDFTGTIANVKLVEVTIADETFLSTPVANGKCYEIETGVLSLAPAK